MRFLYMKEEVGYEEFLATVYEAKTEGTEGKILSAKAKAMMVEKVIDKDEPTNLKDIKQQIQLLTTIMKSTTVGNVKMEGQRGSTISKKEGGLLRFSKENLSGITSERERSFEAWQKPIKCYRCDGWGHGWKECLTLENLKWRELVGAVASSNPKRTGLAPIPNPGP